jgi:histidine ammonia-lyase
MKIYLNFKKTQNRMPAREEVPKEIVKLMLLLKIQSLGYGHSGIQLQTVNRLSFFNNDILPVIYTQGSLEF